jgi:CspA family cold shock protein
LHSAPTPVELALAVVQGDGLRTFQVLFFEEWKMPQGTIKKLITNKGFGFIEGEKGEIFFHHSALEGTAIEALSEGQQVEYEEGSGPKGPRAENVRLV